MSHYSPFIEPLSLDEAFLDVSGMERQYPKIKDIGIAIKNDIHKNIGLIASAGIAPNKFLAKLASDLRKPDGLMWIPYGKEQEILAPLPVNRLWGVGRVTAAALESAGICTIGDVAAVGVSVLTAVAGSQAKRLYELSCGIDKRPLQVSRRPQSVGNEHTYEHDI